MRHAGREGGSQSKAEPLGRFWWSPQNRELGGLRPNAARGLTFPVPTAGDRQQPADEWDGCTGGRSRRHPKDRSMQTGKIKRDMNAVGLKMSLEE